MNYITMNRTDLDVDSTATVRTALESVSGADARWQIFRDWVRLDLDATFEFCGIKDGAKLTAVKPMLLASQRLVEVNPATLVWDENGWAKAVTPGVTFTVFTLPVAVESYFYECVQRSPQCVLMLLHYVQSS